MKLSEIEGLREWVLERARDGKPANRGGDILRLLQEREMLLEALREVAHGCDCLDHAAEARAAVERAES